MIQSQVKFHDIQITPLCLGKGFTASVYQGRHKRTGQIYAVKRVDLSKDKNLSIELIHREIMLQKNFNHPNIVKFYDSHQDGNILYLILEYVPLGSLWDNYYKGKLTQEELMRIFRQIVEAVKYMHSQKTIHRDIKPENILLDQNKNAKLCDFGFSAMYGGMQKRITICGTQDYYPPEILMGQAQNEKVDIWCLGIMLYELLHKRTPFSEGAMMMNSDTDQLIRFKPDVQEKYKKIIRGCLRKTPTKRLSCEDILRLLDENENSQKVSVIQVNGNNKNLFQNQQITFQNIKEPFNFKFMLTKKIEEFKKQDQKRDDQMKNIIKQNIQNIQESPQNRTSIMNGMRVKKSRSPYQKKLPRDSSKEALRMLYQTYKKSDLRGQSIKEKTVPFAQKFDFNNKNLNFKVVRAQTPNKTVYSKSQEPMRLRLNGSIEPIRKHYQNFMRNQISQRQIFQKNEIFKH